MDKFGVNRRVGPRLFSGSQGRLCHPVGVAMAAVSVEGADSDGDQTEEMLRGDAVVVEQRRLQAVRGSWRERRSRQSGRPSSPKTAGKVATDEHTWDLYVAELGIVVGKYPSAEQVVEFAIWLSMHR